MPTRPWQAGSAPPTAHDCFVYLSRIELNNPWATLRLALNGRVTKQIKDAPGLIGFTLNFNLKRKELLTLSAWNSEKEMMAFARAGAHRQAMVQDNPVVSSLADRYEVPVASLPLSLKTERARLEPKPESG